MKKLRPLLLLVVLLPSCLGTWTDESKNKFYRGCTTDALAWAGTPEKAQEYCDCVFTKMTRKYPVAEEAMAHMDSIAKDPDIAACKEEMLRTAK
jgi:hypothetical protein